MHTPVLLEEALNSLRVRSNGLYIDATVGEGGHIKKILELGGQVLGIDWDEEQIEKLKTKIKSPKLVLTVGNFAEIEKIAKESNFYPADGILFDLGLSYGQLADSKKGFSYKKQDEPLDMRLSLESEKTAADLVNSLEEDEIYEIFAKNSEEINSRTIARTLVRARRISKLRNVRDLLQLIDQAIGGKDEKVYSRVFQALRMAVNNELDNLKKGLHGAVDLIKNDGRIEVISFHSVEDRIVKKFITEKKLRQISKTKGDEGAAYERSATLRVFTK